MAEKKTVFARTIWEITQALRDAENLDDALAAGLEAIIKALNSQAGTIWLLNKADDRISPLYNYGPADISGMTVENGQGLVGAVVKSGKAIIVEDTSRDPRTAGMAARSILCVPLKQGEETIGCIQLINPLNDGVYDAEDEKLCRQLTALAAIALEEKGFSVEAGEEREKLFSLQGLTRDITAGKEVMHALRGINLDIYKNELLVLLGEDECAKSALFSVLGGLENPTEGKLLIEGKDISQLPEEERTKYRRQRVGMVPRGGKPVENLSVKANVKLMARLVRKAMNEDEAVELVGLTEQANRYPAALSQAQRERLALACAIVRRPSILLVEEPTAALDAETGAEVLGVIEKIMQQEGTTVVLSTRNPEIAKMADRVVKLKGGLVSSVKRNLRPLRASELEW